MELSKRKQLNLSGKWEIPDGIDLTEFDLSWRPDPYDPPYTHQFGTQHQKTGGPRYVVDESTTVKYQDCQIAKKTSIDDNWQNTESYGFDYTWHPDATEPLMNYQFVAPGEEAGPIYDQSSLNTKTIIDDRVIKKINWARWEIPRGILVESFDFSWLPPAGDPPFIYQFGTQHQKTGGPRYIVKGATNIKYIDSQRSVVMVDGLSECWENTHAIEFDYTWHPDDTEPPFIYQFGTQYGQSAGPRYVTPGATSIKYMDSPVGKRLSDKSSWMIPEGIDDGDFDYSWVPPEGEVFIYQFGTQHQKTGGPRYVVKGATNVKYMDSPRVKRLPTDECWEIPNGLDVSEFDFSWHPDETERPFIYQFGTQHQKTGGPRYIVKNARRTKFIDTQHCIKLPDKTNWEIPQDVNIDQFDFSWHPDDTEFPFIYQFGTQHQKTGGPRYVVKGAMEVKYVDLQHSVKMPDKTNWVIPDCLDVSEFDFSWHPDDTEVPYIYEFGTQWQKTDGPQYVVPGATEIKYVDLQRARILENPGSKNWRNIENMNFDFSWHPDSTEPKFIYQFGTQFDGVPGPKYVIRGATQTKFMDFPVAKLLPDMKKWNIIHPVEEDSFDFSWRPPLGEMPFIHVFGNDQYSAEEMPTLEYLMIGATVRKYHNNLVPKLKIPKLDVVFVSNGETGAEERYQRIVELAARTRNTVKRVDGVNGRETALRRAAEISDTDWFICIPGKLWLNESFDLSWHPPIKNDPKHYIFYAENPVNGLIYGHQAAVCYNKQLVLETIDYGLDFTMSKAHDIVPLSSGIAQYDSDPWMTWRTAFREAIKLKVAFDNGDVESGIRLDAWLTVGNGQYGNLSILGAKHGVDYYNEVNGVHEQLMKTFEWTWLRQRYHRYVQNV